MSNEDSFWDSEKRAEVIHTVNNNYGYCCSCFEDARLDGTLYVVFGHNRNQYFEVLCIRCLEVVDIRTLKIAKITVEVVQ